jgi:hypothetical protein
VAARLKSRLIGRLRADSSSNLSWPSTIQRINLTLQGESGDELDWISFRRAMLCPLISSPWPEGRLRKAV